MDAILHHPRFQRLEGSWRGLAWLLSNRRGEDARVKVALLSCAWRDLDRDLAGALEFDQSHLFRLVYENEFGHAGGEPYGLLVVDEEVSHLPRPRSPDGGAPVDDLSVLGGLASIAAAAFAPVVVSASPALLGAGDFDDLLLSSDVAGIIDDQEHARWRTLAAREDARFVAVALPRILARPPWRQSASRGDGLRYVERVPGPGARPWFAAGYAFAGCVLRAFRDSGWPANVRGVVTDRIEAGLVVELPEQPFRFGAATEWRRSSLSLALTEGQERSLISAGFLPLNDLPQGDAVFGSARGLQTQWRATPGRDTSPFLANRALSSQTSSVLTVSRFAHALKMLARDMVGSSLPPNDIEQRLRRWLMGYVNSDPEAGAEMRVRYPLRSARVSVREVAGNPGTLGCVMHLQPHHQLDDVSTTFRLATSFVSVAAP